MTSDQERSDDLVDLTMASSRREHLRMLAATTIGGGLTMLAPAASAQGAAISVPSMRASNATDDSAAFEAAVQLAVSSGVFKVFLPAGQGSQRDGTYLIGTPAYRDDNTIGGNLASSVEVYGSGKYNTIVRYMEGQHPGRVHGNSYIFFAGARNGANVSDITIRDMSLVGRSEAPGKQKPSQALHLITFGGVSRATLRNLEFRESEGDGLNIGDPLRIDGTHNDNITVTACNFNGGARRLNRNGISILDVTKLTVEGCAFDGWGARSLAAEFPTDPDVAPAQPGAIDIEPEDVWSVVRDVTVQGCAFTNLHNTAFSILWKNDFFRAADALARIFFIESSVRDSFRAFVCTAPNPIGPNTIYADVNVRSLYCERLDKPFEISNSRGVWLYGNSFNDCNMSELSTVGPVKDITIQSTTFQRCGRVDGPTIKQVKSVENVRILGTRAYDCGAPNQINSIYYADAGDIVGLVIFDTRAENRTSQQLTTSIARRNLAATVVSAYVECKQTINFPSYGLENIQTYNAAGLQNGLYACPL